MAFGTNPSSFTLSSGTDVAFSNPTNGALVTYNSSVGKWQNAGNVNNIVYRIVYNTSSSSYPARPSGVPAGYAEYVGPVQPTTWVDGDTWVQGTV